MSDEVDLANAQVELNEQRSISWSRQQANKPIPTSEFCLWCGSATNEGRRFCDRICADDWERFGKND